MPLIIFTIIALVSGSIGLVRESRPTSMLYPVRVGAREIVERVQGIGHTEEVTAPTAQSVEPVGAETVEPTSSVPDTGVQPNNVYTQKRSPTFRVAGGEDEEDDDD